MFLLRIILFPFAVLYGMVTGLRNWLYDQGILKSYTFDTPIIAVGNLSVGGTGKTPQIEYLIRLLSPQYRVAVLSRGYKRKSKGFVLADANATAQTLGDEPFQYFGKFSDIQVAVDTDRVNGILKLRQLEAKPDLILLDDAFQHRRLQAGFYILLTAYSDLYTDDFMLPTGNLREGRNGAKRADVIIITKCPTDISAAEQAKILAKIKPHPKQRVFFSAIAYQDFVFSENEQLMTRQLADKPKTLVAGIAKPEPFFRHLQRQNDVLMQFADHHDFTQQDIETIQQKSKDNLIITTEKDYVRLKGKLDNSRLFYLPISTFMLSGGDDFDKTIKNYVGTSTANR